ncbi:MAG: MBL fold metallo-hydrolase [Candidatus Omnitrophica bacterium]|nr:MBL fold metallo-hydrolase [Candidatus Omnitrophota bacterium]MCM8827084.1 MBL fold metallo-hydrolase [Candidatus Omnitrophota bacterium]
MDNRQLKIFTLGSIQTNCYLIFNLSTKKAILIDAPEDIEEVVDFINENSLYLEGVFLTHGHIDHIKGLDNLNVPFYIHREDKDFLFNPQLNLSYFLGYKFNLNQEPYLLDEGDYKIESFSIHILHTPGHTPGSISILIENWLFSGDTLFFDSIGRTDIPYASYEQIVNSIKNKLVKLDSKTLVFPGHGSSTTIERESKCNPFLK